MNENKKEYEVRYFFDYGSRTCLWSNNEKTKLKYGNRINMEELNISEQLKNSMNELIKEYDNELIGILEIRRRILMLTFLGIKHGIYI